MDARPAWFGWSVAAATVTGAVLRLAWAVAVRDVPVTMDTDQGDYLRIAAAWAEGNFTASGVRGPIYPALLAVVEVARDVVPGSTRLLVGLIQILLSGATIAILGCAGRRWFGSVAGAAGAWCLALWPNQVVGSAAVMSEGVATPALFLAATLLLWNPPGRATWVRYLSSALLGATAVLARPALLPALVVLVALAWRTPNSLTGSSVRSGLAYATVALVALGSWAAILSVRAGEPVAAISTAGDVNLCMGNNPVATGSWSDEAIERYCPWPGGNEEFDQARSLRNTAIGWMLAEPGRQPRLVAHRVAATFTGDSYWLDWYPSWREYQGPGNVGALRVATGVWFLLAVPLTAIGAALAAARNRRVARWYGVLAVAILLGPVMTIGDSRFHDPMVPFACVVIGLAMSCAARRVRMTVLDPQPGQLRDRELTRK